MLKKNNVLILALIFILVVSTVIAPVTAKADTQESYSSEAINNITVKANISNANNFNGEIYFFIKDSKGMKRVFVLDKDNNYSKTYELPIGRSQIQGITIYDKDKNSILLPYTYEGNLNTTTEQASVFTINLDNNATTENSTQEQKSTKDANNNTNDVDETSQQEKVEENNNNQKNDVSLTPKTKTIINLVIDAILIIAVGGMLLYIRHKEKKKKDEEE